MHNPNQFRPTELNHLPVPTLAWGGWRMSLNLPNTPRNATEVPYYGTVATSPGQHGTSAVLIRGKDCTDCSK